MPLNKKCEICGKNFLVKKSHFNYRYCCSNKCRNLRFEYSLAGSNNPNYKNTGYKECLRCGKQYHAYAKNRKYCGDDCANISNRNENRKVPRKKRDESLIKRKPRSKKKYRCSVCCVAEVSKKAKYCKPCRMTRNNVLIACKCCGNMASSFKWRIKVFCSKKCQMSCRTGENNPNYIDGRTPENKRIRHSKEYKEWRISVFERDKFTCQHCGKIGGVLHADHIKPFSLFPDLRLSLSNGRTLCKPCHEKTPTWLSGARKFKNVTDHLELENIFVDTK
jgi:5-methylcytosine-specific restriction endonuclease McrA